MNTATAGKVELRIPARAEFLGVARLAVSAIASQMDFDVDAVEDVKMGVSEACTNAIQHAGATETEREIHLICSLESGQLVVEVHDAGAGFDPALCRQEVDLDQLPPEDLPDSGYGLLLIRALMDECQWFSQPGVGTLVRMVKRCSRAS